jgi:hypothetical protein
VRPQAIAAHALSDLVTIHLLFTTQMRFARKIDNIRRALGDHAADDDDEVAWHWRRWVAMAQQGRINEDSKLPRLVNR